MITRTVTTTAAYSNANSVKPDPSIVRIDVTISGPVTVRLYKGIHGQMEVVGELTLTQSQIIPGATGIEVKDAVAGTPETVVLTAWQVGDPTPLAVPVGATQVVSPSAVLTGDVSSAGAITAGTGFTVAGTTSAGLVVTFTNPFAASPAVTVVVVSANTNRIVRVSAISASAFTIDVANAAGAGQNERVIFTAQAMA